MSTLEIAGLRAAVAGKEILHGIDLTVVAPARCTPSWAPTAPASPRCRPCVMGKPGYEVLGGSVTLDGVDLLALPTWQRAAGRPVPRHAVPDRGARRARSTPCSPRRSPPGAATTDGLDALLAAEAERIGFDERFLDRPLNVDLSGGEKKRNETLQLAVLAAEDRHPRRARLRPRHRRPARLRPAGRGGDQRDRARRARHHPLQPAARRDPRLLAGPRSAGAVRRARPLPPARLPAPDLGALRPGRARRSGGRGRSATAQSVEERVAMLRELGVRRFSALPYAHKPGVATYLNGWARPSRPRYRRACGRRRSTPSRRRRSTSGSWSTPASRSSRCTCRSGLRAATIRCSTTCGRGWRRAGRRSWCTPAPARSPNALHRPRAAGAGAAAAPARGRGRPPRRARSTASSWRWPSASSGCTSTPRWCSRTSSRSCRRTRGAAAAAGRPARQGAAGQRLPDDPVPLPHQLEALERLGLGEDWLRAVCWDNGARLFGMSDGGATAGRLRAHNSRGADRFRLGTFVPGEAGRGASVIS